MTLISMEEHPVTDVPEPQVEEWPLPDEPTGPIGPPPLPTPPGVRVAPAGDATERRVSLNFKVMDCMVTVRGDDASEVHAVLRELDQYGVYAALAQARQSFTSYLPAPALPAQGAPTPPPSGGGAPAPAPSGWGQPSGPPPVTGRAAPAAPGGRGGNATPPGPGWYKINVPFAEKDRFSAYRNENQQFFRGKVRWHEKGDYFVAPEVVEYFSQYGPVPAS